MQNNKNFGLSDSLITSVKEAMNPNQKKLDKNNNGKLDADDFKKLRGEDAEVDEVSKKTLGSYIKKASHDVATKSAAVGRYGERSNVVKDQMKKGDYSNYQKGKKDSEFADRTFSKSWKRREGIAKATDKLTKEEVEEASKCNSTNEGTMCEVHGNKACPTMAEAQTPQQKAAQAALATQRGEYDAGKKGGAINRMALMKKKALQKIAMGKTKNEEVEQVDEEKYTYKAATFNGNTVEGTGPTQEDAIKDAKEKAKKMNTTIRKRISMKKEDVTREETEITEADDAVAKQIKAKKEQIKKQIQQKIAQKQMSVMQQKAQKTIQNIKASNDKDVYVNMKKKGKDEIEVSPELREAEDFPSDRNSHGED